MNSYFKKLISTDAFDGWSNYKHGRDPFRILLDLSKHYDKKLFWHIASLDEKTLSTFALNLLFLNEH